MSRLGAGRVGERGEDVRAGEHADGFAVGLIEDDQVRDAMLGHQLGGNAQRAAAGR
jgi:hypothetical protein